MPTRPRKLVLTGAPGSGKSTLVAELAAAEPARFLIVPEAATRTYARLGTRWDKLDADGRRAAQRAIYAWQLEQEADAERAAHGRALLLDRGTLDGAAYWPDGPAAYWAALGTTVERELARYDAVLLLESAAALGVYDGDASNPVRFETAAEAVASGDRLAALWGAHPCLTRVPASPSFDDKRAAVARAVHAWAGLR